MKLRVVLLALLWAALPARALPNGYTYTRTVTIGASAVSGSLSNFPLLISGTFGYLATVANGGAVVNTTTLNSQTVPADLIFTFDSGGTLLLNWEVASYNATTGQIEIWVQFPTLSNSAVIYMFYGKSSVTTYLGSAAFAWDSFYKGVYHLANGSTLSSIDSTPNANNGTPTSVTATTGQIDGAGSYNGTTSMTAAGSDPSLLNVFATGGTVEAWVKPLGAGGSNNGRIANKTATSDTLPMSGWTFQILTGLGIKFGIGFSGSNAGWSSVATLTSSVWSHVAATYSAASTSNVPALYVNGSASSISVVGSPTGTVNSDTGLALTLGNIAAQTRGWNGSLDEVRISTTVRTSAWIAAEYSNQNNPSGFYAISNATGGATGGGYLIIW